MSLLTSRMSPVKPRSGISVAGGPLGRVADGRALALDGLGASETVAVDAVCGGVGLSPLLRAPIAMTTLRPTTATAPTTSRISAAGGRPPFAGAGAVGGAWYPCGG